MGDFQGHPFRGNQWTGKGYRYTGDLTEAKAEILGQKYRMPLSLARISELAGASEGSDVDIGMLGESTIAVSVTLPNHAGDLYRLIRLEEREISNEEFKVSPSLQGKGIGLDSFSQQVEAAQALGFRAIETNATGSPGSDLNGYYTWARLGYESTEKVTGPGGKSTTVGAIMRAPGGAAWWKDNGHGFLGRFSLASGSVSMRVLREYQRLKRQKEAR